MTAAPPSTPAADRHLWVAATFTDRVRHVTDSSHWDAPTPVDGWLARDVVAHLVTWFPGFLAAGTGIELRAGPDVATDPLGAWSVQSNAIQAILDDAESSERVFAHPMVPELALPDAIDRFYTADAFMHTWDLARATAQDDTLDEAFCDELLTAMAPMDGVLRQSGHYGPKVVVAPDARVQDRLLGFIGRDPLWRPAT